MIRPGMIVGMGFSLAALYGCASSIANSITSAGYVGCPPDEITVQDVDSDMGGVAWTAICRGKTFMCSGTVERVSCTELRPRATARSTAEPPRPAHRTIRVSFGPQGELLIDGVPVKDDEQARARLGELVENGPPDVVVQAGAQVPHSRLQEVIALLREFHVSSVGVTPDHPATPGSSPGSSPPDESPEPLPNPSAPSPITPPPALPPSGAPTPLTTAPDAL